MPPASTALCSSADRVELDNSRENQHRDDGKDIETMLKQDMDCNNQERDVEVPEEEKDEIMGRLCHLTGDSGIEVCLCSQGTESHRTKALEELLSSEGHGSSIKFCDGCGARDDKNSDQGTELNESPPPQLHPLCQYLHTINEQ